MGPQVEHAHGGAGARQPGYRMAPDEPGPAGHQDPAPLQARRVAHVWASARVEVWGSSLVVSRQLTVGMTAATSTRSLWRSTTSNRWSISVVDSSVGLSPSSTSAVCLAL